VWGVEVEAEREACADERCKEEQDGSSRTGLQERFQRRNRGFKMRA